MKNFFQVAYLISLLCLLISCDKEKEYDKAKAISAFASVDPIRLDPTLEKTAIKIPPQKNNDFSSGSSSSQNQRVENFEKKFSVIERGFFGKKRSEISLTTSSQTWFFYSGNNSDHFVFPPIIKNEKVYILDTAGVLVARDLVTKKTLWKSQIFKKSFLKNYKTPRIGYADGTIIAIAGINKIAAASEVDGKVLWVKEISSIPISNPVSDGKILYVSTNDNKLYAFDVKSGELQWTQSGISRNTAIFGTADPVIYKDFVIVSYSSGEIYALNKTSGEPLWSQDLNLSKAINSDFYLNDVDATPLVVDGVVYAIGNGGLMMAIDIKSGNYLWRKRIGGIVDFWGAEEFLFLINNEDKLLAVNKKTGGIKWISQLPDFKKPNKAETKFIYSGLIMVGDKLLIARRDGELLITSPLDGKIEKTISLKKKISHSPIVINGKIYLHAIGKYIIDLIEIE